MTILKKLAAAALAGAMLCTSAAAVNVTTVSKKEYKVENGQVIIPIEKSDAIPTIAGNQYVLLVAKGTQSDSEVTIDASTLTYIDQAEAGPDGALDFTVKPKSVQKGDIVLLGGEFNGKTGPLIIGYIDVDGNLVSISIPTLDVSGQNKADDITFKMTLASGSEVNVTANADGSVSDLPISEGETAVIQISRPGYLTLTIKNYRAGADIGIYLESFKSCAGNVNGDKLINHADVYYLLDNFSASTSDVNRDGRVNHSDIYVILNNYGNKAEKMTYTIP